MLLDEWNWEDARRVWEHDAAERAAKEATIKTQKETRMEDIASLYSFGMAPEKIAQALKLPLTLVEEYLGLAKA
jgi:hypothetical protein